MVGEIIITYNYLLYRGVKELTLLRAIFRRLHYER